MSGSVDPLPGSPRDGVDVELYCRASTATARAVDRYADRIDRLREAGPVEGVEVRTWPARVDLSAPGDEVVAAVERFEDWADDAGVSLRPAFDRREFTSEFTGEHRRTLVTPVACLATYDGDDLLAVYPHTDDERTRTVEDALDALRAAANPGSGTASTPGVGVSGD